MIDYTKGFRQMAKACRKISKVMGSLFLTKRQRVTLRKRRKAIERSKNNTNVKHYKHGRTTRTF